MRRLSSYAPSPHRAYALLLDPNVMEEASVIGSMAILTCGMLYFAAEGQVGVVGGLPAWAMSLLDAVTLGAIVVSSTMMIGMLGVTMYLSQRLPRKAAQAAVVRVGTSTAAARQECQGKRRRLGPSGPPAKSLRGARESTTAVAVTAREMQNPLVSVQAAPEEDASGIELKGMGTAPSLVPEPPHEGAR